MSELDRFSVALLKELVKDGRASHVELSQRIGLSPTACARRQKALEQEGVITGYQAILGDKALGLGVHVIVRISSTARAKTCSAASNKPSKNVLQWCAAF